MNIPCCIRKGGSVLFLALLTGAHSFASNVAEFREKARSSTLEWYKLNPVWGSYIGYREYDERMPDLSDFTLDYYDSLIWQGFGYLHSLDTAGWEIDDQIDYILELASAESFLPSVRETVHMKSTTATYSENCLYGVFLLAARQDRPLADRYKCLMGRLTEIPGYLAKTESLVTEFNQADLIFSIRTLQNTYELINGFCDILADSFPQDNGKISTSRDRAVLAIRDFISFCAKRGPDAPGSVPLGEEKFKRLLKFDYQIDIEPDSLMALADNEFWKADSLVKLYAQELPVEANEDERHWGMNDIIDKPSIDSLKIYCQNEIVSITKFLEENEILDITNELPPTQFIEIPRYLNHAGYYSDFYVGPGVLNPNSTGYFYTFFNMLNRMAGEGLPASYIPEKFRGDLVKYIIPGQHFLSEISGKQTSFIRQTYLNDMFVKGWYEYIRGLLIERGLFGNNPKIPYDYFCDMRAYALGTYVDVGFHTGKFTLDSARTFVIQRIGADSSGYRINSALNAYMPLVTAAGFLGRLQFLQMKENAMAKEGNKFILKVFHSRILSEGCIPPALIARKYGW